MRSRFFKFFFIGSMIFFFGNCSKDDNSVPILPNEDFSLKIENNIKVEMRDGVELAVNVYRPDADGTFPVILSFGPYGKDNLPAEYDPVDDGNIIVSEYAAFETPDPAFWVQHGYIVIAADTRGSGQSEGTLNVFENQEAEDYYDLIEWAGVQSWSSGKVGLNGVSIYGISQWKAAALNPPHLTAMICWEGFTDPYRDGFYHGGIPSEFIDGWFQYRLLDNLSATNTGYRDLPMEVAANPLASASIYQELSIGDRLAQITIPSYIAVSIQDHGLHTRGTINGFQAISSSQKWLELHGRKKWEFYYSQDAMSRQKKFFDHFLKETDNSILSQPTVRYELREAYYDGNIETANNWPISGRTLSKLYLDASNNTLNNSITTNASNVSYDATVLEDPELITDNQRVIFKHTFTQETDIVGTMKLKLFVSTDQANDIDLFVGIQKADANDNIIYFEGPGDAEGQVASGWLRVSKRALDMSKTTEEVPYHSHDMIETITPNQIVEVDVEIWPTTTKYKAGEQLILVIQGNDIVESQESHKNNVNYGNTTIYTGENRQSYLQIPTL
ncbi:CocE/NonD family hydrolase [uncultured Kordia sp.]|uniref:CocE/NonD family hydrolase n=1 Tax=uncultured Kordia sp. TaxID=507699 RepID=UPI00260332C3|nr:CocE/NonD family hydrolase [uncultured Kordia sp.]